MTTETLNTSPREPLRFAFGDAALGTIMVAESTRGIVALFIGDDRAALLRDLKDAFPEDEFVSDEASLAESVAKAVALVNAPYRAIDLTLDLRGSPLQMAVWTALQAIPAGETRTYGAIARGLAITATAQDVGAACAANRIAIAVPCHRVVRSDGTIAGYRWGMRRKRRLINMEGVAQ
jgi:AraC family transcriptional regulator of adaptative response/methylated-DNA-[protein]-cysteine methyltransferase